MRPRTSLIDFLKTLWQQIQDDQVFNGAAALAYFFMLATFPAAILGLAVLRYVSIPHLRQAIADLANQVLPHQAAALLEETVRHLVSNNQGGLLTFGFIFALWSASSGTSALMEQVNIAYDATDRRPYWKVRGIAILLMLLFFLLVVGSLSLVIFGGVVQSWVASMIGWSRSLLIFFAAMRWIIIGIALLLALAVTYRFGPDVNVKFRFTSAGNVVAAALIALASVAFRFYVLKFGNYSAYGAVGAIIILMLWLYLIGIALLVGSEINAILDLDKPKPSESGDSAP